MSAGPKMVIEGMLGVEEAGVWGEEVFFPSVHTKQRDPAHVTIASM
jgi:hypothetical protein